MCDDCRIRRSADEPLTDGLSCSYLDLVNCNCKFCSSVVFVQIVFNDGGVSFGVECWV